MKRSALVLLLLGSANASCFRPTLECARCSPRVGCPSGLSCNEGFCTTPTGSCASALEGTDGPIEHPGETSICVGTTCIPQPPGVIVWADRASLPPENQPITTWIDRSGNNHPVAAYNPGLAPLVMGGFADIEGPQEVLAVQDGTALHFDSSDFTVMVLANCSSAGSLSCVFDNTVMAKLGIRLYCNVGVPYLPDAGPLARARLQVTDTSLQVAQSSVLSLREDTPNALHLYVARRIGDTLQLRIDGKVEGDETVTSKFDQDAPLFVGSCATQTRSTGFRGTLGAVIVIKASLDDSQTFAIEDFVLRTMGPDAPPLP